MRKTDGNAPNSIGYYDYGTGNCSDGSSAYYGNIGMHGNYAANEAVNTCDLLISIGTRFNDRITGKLGTFASRAKIIHIDIDTAAISKKCNSRYSDRWRCQRRHPVNVGNCGARAGVQDRAVA